MAISKHIIKYFADFITAQLGIVYAEGNYYQLEARLDELIKHLGLASGEELHQKFQTQTTLSMRTLLLDYATNNETLFFRDQSIFVALEGYLNQHAPDFAHREAPLRFWSAACSYGQEPYSLAMMLDGMQSRLPKAGYEILATDISERALRHAEAGRYTEFQMNRGLTAELKHKYFLKSPAENEWDVRPELKRSIHFQKFNLLDSFESLGTFDVIFCRNVLIYQPTESRRQIIKRIHQRLAPQGILIIGSSESLFGISEQFDMIQLENAVLYQAQSRAGSAA